MGSVIIHVYDPAWPGDFETVEEALRGVVGAAATRIDHIGSTSVPGLDAKDVIDVQISVGDADDLERASQLLASAGWVPSSAALSDHPVPGMPAASTDREKRLFAEPPGGRRVNIHVRVQGRPNQRYPLLFRDYLRAHPASAAAYATLKRHLADLLPEDSERYSDVKDPACDLIYFAAEAWARGTGWTPGSDPG